MTQKPIYSSGFPFFSILFFLLPLIVMVILILNGMSFTASLFYGIILIFTSFLLNKDNQWIKLYNDQITIVNLNPFLGSIKIPFDKIKSIDLEDGIETKFIRGTITGVPDRIYIKYDKGGTTKSVLIRTIGLDNDNPLINFLSKKAIHPTIKLQ